VEVVASLSQGRTAAAQCGLFTYKSVPVIFEPPCISRGFTARIYMNLFLPFVFTYASRFIHFLLITTVFGKYATSSFFLKLSC